MDKYDNLEDMINSKVNSSCITKWKQDGALVYRLTNRHGRNYDEINISLCKGNRFEDSDRVKDATALTELMNGLNVSSLQELKARVESIIQEDEELS